MQNTEIIKVKAKPRVTVREQLLDLVANSEECLQVPGARAGSMYTMIHGLRKEGYRFKTQKIEGSLHVWRLDDVKEIDA